MTRAPLSGAKAVSAKAARAQGISLLGRLATYTLPDDPVNATTLVRVWGNHGLEVDVLPDKRRGADIFMSACRSVETRRGNGHGVEVAVDEVMQNAAEVVYQITRKVRDEGAKVIEHSKSMTLAYDKSNDAISVRELEDYDALGGLEDAIREHWAKNQRTVPGPKIRNAVRETLLNLGAQNVRRKAGGLYFVPDKFAAKGANVDTEPTLLGLQSAFAELWGDRADFHIIPLVRDEEAEQMVAKHFALNVGEASRALLEKATNRLRAAGADGKAVRTDLMSNLWNERRKLSGAVAQFEQLVGLSRDEIDANFAQLDAALTKLNDLGSDDTP